MAGGGQNNNQVPEGTQAALMDRRMGLLEKYRKLVTGGSGLGSIIRYELITGLFSWMPGLAGLGFRLVFYRFLLRKLGRSAVIGRNVTLRHPQRTSIGSRVVVEDNAVLDAKGSYGDGISIGDDVFIGRGTIFSMGGGTIEVGDGSSFGSNCRIGSLGTIRIGKKVLVAAYVYILAANHRYERTDIPVIDQPVESQGGIEIGDGTWIGAYAMIMDGVRIGEHSIIGAHTLVTQDVPPYSVVVGVPGRVIRDRRDVTAGA
jgi:acetyltransferase-like isoleucine patch superfamily enzyme